MTKIPVHVMRFYGNIQYALECIALKQITFLHVDKLNDPFDPYIEFDTGFNEDYQALINYIQENSVINPLDFQKRLPEKNWYPFIESMQYLSKHFRNSMYIFSTSAITESNHPKDNLYMWSHYGNGHRGVAIEFDTTLLTKAVIEQNNKIGGYDVDVNNIWCEIKYQNEIPRIIDQLINFVIHDTPVHDEETWLKTELANILMKRVSLKNTGWEIEQEWRLMWENDETRLQIFRLNLLDDSIVAVYLGSRYPLSNQYMNDDLIVETKRNFPNAKIFLVKKGRKNYALDFDLIS